MRFWRKGSQCSKENNNSNNIVKNVSMWNVRREISFPIFMFLIRNRCLPFGDKNSEVRI